MRGVISGDRFQKRREREKIAGGDEPDRWGPGVSVGRRGMPVPFRDGALPGLRPNLGLG
jgi:hypothetical protein